MAFVFTARSWLQTAVFLAAVLWIGIRPDVMVAKDDLDRTASFEELLERMASAPGDACNGKGADLSRYEYYLFERADEAATHALNEQGPVPSAKESSSAAKDRLMRALTKLEEASAEINKSWAAENRFHFEVLDLPPAIAVKMTYRNRATFTVLGVPQFYDSSKANADWRAVRGSDDGRFDPRSGYDWLDLFPLQRGPSKRVRFLAKFGGAGCGSGVGVSYYGYEWNPEGFGHLTQFIKLEGAVSHEEPAKTGRASKKKEKDLSSWFPPIGELKTAGPVISLPYCWFSSVDTSNSPSLCAVDSFAIRGDRARFIRRVTNRPDLVAIARAVEYGQAHDYVALRAYCISDEVARKLLSSVPPFVYGGAGLKLRRISGLKETVEIGDSEVLRFDVEKHAGRWLVARFRIQ